MKTGVICALIPTRKRVNWLRRVVASLEDTAPAVQIVVIGDPDDPQTQEACHELGVFYVQTSAPKLGCSAAWNTGLAAFPDCAAYVLGADDLIFYPGWLEATLGGLEQLGGSGLVGFNDGRKDGNRATATHYLMTRDFIIQHHGGVMAIPHYTGEMVDLEAKRRAEKVDKYLWVPAARVYHDWHGGPMGDETYRLAWERREKNRQIYAIRESMGFPDDFPPVLTDETPALQKAKKGKGKRGKGRQ